MCVSACVSGGGESNGAGYDRGCTGRGGAICVTDVATAPCSDVHVNPRTFTRSWRVEKGEGQSARVVLGNHYIDIRGFHPFNRPIRVNAIIPSL